MFNFGTIGAYKQARNNPRVKAAEDTKNGQVLVLNNQTGVASFPQGEEAKGKDLWVAFNIVDKPETLKTSEFTIEAGEYVRAFYLADLTGLPVLVGHQVIGTNYEDIVAGDILVPEEGTGKWVKVDSVSAEEYAIKLEVVAKNTFADKGIEAIVHA